MLLRCMINGEQVEKETEPTKRLLDFLREDCGLTGVKGAAVRVNAVPVRYCWTEKL